MARNRPPVNLGPSPNRPVEMQPRAIPWQSGIPPAPPIPGTGQSYGAGFGGGRGHGQSPVVPMPDFTVPRNPNPATYIREDWHLANIIERYIVLAAAQSVLVLDQPDGERNFLMIRNSSPGAEIIYVSWGQPASVNSTFALPAGGIALYDMTVPQQDMWALGSAATATISFSYSNLSPWN